MASKYVQLEGIAEWAKVFKENRDVDGYKGAWKDTNGRTTINLIMADEEFEKLKKSGTMKRGVPDPQGRGMNVKFDRKWETGREWDSGAPEVIRADGNPWSFEEDGEIGNGSRVRIQVVVTPLPNQGVVSTRLEKIKVLEHVIFQGRDDGFYRDESDTTSGESNSKNDQVSTASVDDDESEIPF